MKAITLTQPWATLVAIGAKRIETRSWTTRYRGVLAIHAAKGFPKNAQALCRQEPFYSVLTVFGEKWNRERTDLADLVKHPLMPLGAIVAVCELSEVIHIPPQWEMSAEYPAEPERSFGDYTLGRFAWVLTNVRQLKTPIAARGALGLWEWQSPVPVDQLE